jgi:2-dehydro-3-deoxyphosphogluconate aldolase/(4S)-4-hydroxy-2-oxoglutarate aldolase
MKTAFSWDLFHELPVVGILRGFRAVAVERLVEAALRGGLRNIEVTMDSEGAAELIRLARRVAGGAANVGAGTVLGLEDLRLAREAGAEFIVTPIVAPGVIEACRAERVPVIPGAFTPTEIHRAWELGADLVKVFPADQLGPAYVRSVKAPLPKVKLLPTGGVTVETLPAFKKAGADGFGVGSPLFAREKAESGDWAWVEAQARRFAEAFRAAR